jgi:hypothetical protein
MKTREIILILIAAAFGGVAIVTWSGEEAANQRAAKISKEAAEARLKSVADIKALNAKAAKDAAAAKKAADDAPSPPPPSSPKPAPPRRRPKPTSPRPRKTPARPP